MSRVANPYRTRRETAERTDGHVIDDSHGETALTGLLEALRTAAQAFEHGAQVQLRACAADLRFRAAAWRARAEAARAGSDTSDDVRADAACWLAVAEELDRLAAAWLGEW